MAEPQFTPELTIPLCQCGCGDPAPVARRTNSYRGIVRGVPLRYIHGHNMKNRPYRVDAYRQAATTNHPRMKSMISLHVKIAEDALGHVLPRRAQVHHVDGNKTNNSNHNLVICHDGEYHSLLHIRTRVVKAGGNPNTQRVCTKCHQLKPFCDFGICRSGHRIGKLRQPCKACDGRHLGKPQWKSELRYAGVVAVEKPVLTGR